MRWLLSNRFARNRIHALVLAGIWMATSFQSRVAQKPCIDAAQQAIGPLFPSASPHQNGIKGFP